jgi:hypothetical protein
MINDIIILLIGLYYCHYCYYNSREHHFTGPNNVLFSEAVGFRPGRSGRIIVRSALVKKKLIKFDLNFI